MAYRWIGEPEVARIIGVVIAKSRRSVEDVKCYVNMIAHGKSFFFFHLKKTETAV